MSRLTVKQGLRQRGALAAGLMLFALSLGNHSTVRAAGEAMEHDMSAMSMQGGSPPANARDPHAYAGGTTLDSGPYLLPGVSRLHLADEHVFGVVAVDRLEAVESDQGDHGVYELQSWYGTTYERLVLKAEGEVAAERVEESETELLYSRAVTAFWNLQAGMRHDSSEGPDRNWLALGVAGLAPYWLEIDGGLYLGAHGRSMLQVEAEYELLLTQRWVLQPLVEFTAYGREDSEVGVGSGLARVRAGLRLRYEFSRQFAPYIGLEWQGEFGATADFSRAEGGDTRSTSAVAGVRFWF